MTCRQPSGALRRAYGLCAQLMHFFRQTLLYMTFEVAEPAWRRFQAALAAAGTVDQARLLGKRHWSNPAVKDVTTGIASCCRK